MANANPLAAVAGKFGDLKQRLWFLLLALIVYRIGTYIPIPGIDPAQLAKLFSDNQNGLAGLFNMFSGGAVQRASVFVLGISPYITASILMQLAAEMLPSLKELKKDGEAGRRKVTQYTRYATLVLALFWAFFMARSQMALRLPNVSPAEFVLTTMVSLVAGSMFLMWLGEQITERGLGNGISVLITAGIVSGLPGAISHVLTLAASDSRWILGSILLLVFALLVVAAVVFVERGQRKLIVNYQRRQVGNKVMQAQSSHMPLKVNMSGVMPAIFGSTLLLIPTTITGFAGNSENPVMLALKDISSMMQVGSPLHMVLFAAAIIFFSYFYTALTFNPKDMADNLKKSGAVLPGVRPGEQTGRYIEAVVLRLTLTGALYMVAVCLIPDFLSSALNTQILFGGTSILIVVVVSMDFMAQVQAQMMSQQYESLLKKANFKGAN
ncbi:MULTISPECIES: preprotein translocase subunit SecY [Leeia]|uniref:Protein translocase subunit SecY n=1 Tax=Leeia aquatica TaxID=2725557 RepID=A0A847S6Y6_9NEIS|nr:preprotein translocase subunit SecY [Leeia aquatica]NLR74807.1 preprotein translocase subunit SecY [Leeia aquatica]